MFSNRQSNVQFSIGGKRKYSYVQYQTVYCSGFYWRIEIVQLYSLSNYLLFSFYGRIETVQLCPVIDNLIFSFLWEDRDSIVMFSIRQSTVQFSMEGQRWYSYNHYQTIFCSGVFWRKEIVQLYSLSDYLLFRFLWEEGDGEDSWEVQLARRYYDKLFKEYCIIDLSRYLTTFTIYPS